MSLPAFFPPVELWLYIVAVGGAFGVLAGLYLKVVLPFVRYLRRASTEIIIGDIAQDVKSIKDRVAGLTADVAALREEVGQVRKIAEERPSALGGRPPRRPPRKPMQ